MSDYKTLFGVVTVLIGLVSYSFYFRGIFRGKTKPDAYSWLIWGFLATIIFFAQVTKGGGAGTWATALTAVVCLLIAVIAFSRDDGHIKVIDKISLVGASVGIGLWYYTKNPLFAVLLAIMVGALGFVPTFRKAFSKPHEETAITYFLNAFKFAIALLALTSINPVTVLYPVAMVAMNGSLVTMLFFRRGINIV